MTIMMDMKRYTGIPVPALAIFASPHVQETWMNTGTDPLVREEAKAYFTTIDALAEKQAVCITYICQMNRTCCVKSVRFLRA